MVGLGIHLGREGIDQDDFFRADRHGLQPGAQCALGQQRMDPSVLDAERDTGRRIGGIDGEESPARLGYRQLCDHHLRCAGGKEGDQGVRADIPLAEIMGQSVGAPVDLAIGQHLPGSGDGECVRLFPGIVLDATVNRRVPWRTALAMSKDSDELVAFFGREQRQLPDRQTGRARAQIFQQGAEVPGEPVDRRLTKAISLVKQPDLYRRTGHDDEAQGKIRPGMRTQRIQAKVCLAGIGSRFPGGTHLGKGIILEAQDAFEQGLAGGDLRPATDFSQRNMLKLPAGHLRILQRAQPFDHRHIAIHGHSRRQGVDE